MTLDLMDNKLYREIKYNLKVIYNKTYRIFIDHVKYTFLENQDIVFNTQ